MALPGLELLYIAAKQELRSASDAMVCILHWNFISNGFGCIGVGEEVCSFDDDGVSEMLPAGWNNSQETYVLQYQPKDSSDIHILKVILIDESFLVHVLRLSDEKIVSMNIRPSDYVSSFWKCSFKDAFYNLHEIKRLFQENILNGLEKKRRGNESKRKENLDYDNDSDPLSVQPRLPQHSPPNYGVPLDPYNVGRADLDPLGSGHGGGMFMEPPGRPRPDLFHSPPSRGPYRGPRLPRGSVPPGARFDPFGPPGSRPNPDPDHFPPPGYDMFM